MRAMMETKYQIYSDPKSRTTVRCGTAVNAELLNVVCFIQKPEIELLRRVGTALRGRFAMFATD